MSRYRRPAASRRFCVALLVGAMVTAASPTAWAAIDEVSVSRGVSKTPAFAWPPVWWPIPSLPISQPAPAVPPPVGSMFHCVWPRYSDAERDAVLDELAGAGISSVRIDVSWSRLEDTKKGARNAGYLARVDSCVRLGRQHDLRLVLQLWQTPKWANGGRAENVPPTISVDFADIAKWFAARYRGQVWAWELWNEPNNGTFWTGSVGKYTALLKAGYTGVKAGDPGALVSLGGLMYNDSAYLRAIYAKGGRGSFDVVSTHPYQGTGDQPPEQADGGRREFFTHTPSVRSVMVSYGDGGKPIWFTEFGWSAHDNTGSIPSWARGVSERQQADFAVRAVKYAAANWPYVGAMFWYKERSWNLPSADPAWLVRHLEGYGLLRADGSRRPVYEALRSYLAR
jgi:polysaccharide biosynthesis protein PslG